MTKQDLIDVLAQKFNLPKTQAGDCLNAIIDEIGKALKKGDSVVLTGFGTFMVSKRKARMGRNPKTGQAINIPAGKVPRFKAGKALKEMIK